MDDPTIRHLPEASRFEILVAGRVVGRAEYRQHDGIRTFTRTDVDEAQRGRGVAGALVAAALEQTLDAGFEVEPKCPFVRSYVEKHPELIDLVSEARPGS